MPKEFGIIQKKAISFKDYKFHWLFIVLYPKKDDNRSLFLDTMSARFLVIFVLDRFSWFTSKGWVSKYLTEQYMWT